MSYGSASVEINIHTSCWTMTKGTFFLLVILGFCAICQKAEAQITLGKPVLTAPSVSVVNSVEELFCKLEEIPTNDTILYQFYNEDILLGEYSAHAKEEGKLNVIIKIDDDGKLVVCKASVQNNSEVNSTFSDWKNFTVLVPVEGAHIISSPSLEDLWEEDKLTLQCNITKGTYVLYEWYLNDRLLHSESFNNQLPIESLSRWNSGNYTCVAKNYFNETQDYISKSEGRDVHINEYLSGPVISFEVVKEADGQFNSHVKCQVTRGSTPIYFTLYRNDHNVSVVISEYLNASFVVPIVLDQDMGTVYCHANNGISPVWSIKTNLTVESVGGNVTMTLEKHVGQDFDVFGIWLHCHVERGMFPQYYWFLNNRRLERKGKLHLIYPTPHGSALIVRLDPHGSSNGVYHCEAFNSFDNTTSISSPKSLITHEVFNEIQTGVAAAVFTLFALLGFTVLACCIYGVVLRKKQARTYMFRLKDFADMHSTVDDNDDIDDTIEEIEEYNYEEPKDDDLDTDIYIEDIDVVQASMLEDSDENEVEDEEEGMFKY